MNYVSIDEVTATAQTVLKMSDNMDRNIWKQWIYLATLDLGLSDDEIKVCTLIPHNFSANLPDDCRQIIEVAVFDSNGHQLVHKYRTGKERMYVNQHIVESPTTNSEFTALLPVDVSNDMHNLHLGTNADMVSYIKIRYFAYPVDINGQPMVREEDVMACVYFIRYMDALRQDDNRSKIAQDQINWFREADRARARKKMSSMTPDKARSIMKSLMKVVTPFTSIQDY